jgi:hypothetical protein
LFIHKIDFIQYTSTILVPFPLSLSFSFPLVYFGIGMV